MANIKRVDCALLPPCSQTMQFKLLRARYVAKLWARAGTAFPGSGLSPLDHGWSIQDQALTPIWYVGEPIPEGLFGDSSDGEIEDIADDEVSEDESGDEAWNEHSDIDDDDDDDADFGF